MFIRIENGLSLMHTKNLLFIRFVKAFSRLLKHSLKNISNFRVMYKKSSIIISSSGKVYISRIKYKLKA